MMSSWTRALSVGSASDPQCIPVGIDLSIVRTDLATMSQSLATAAPFVASSCALPPPPPSCGGEGVVVAAASSGGVGVAAFLAEAALGAAALAFGSAALASSGGDLVRGRFTPPVVAVGTAGAAFAEVVATAAGVMTGGGGAGGATVGAAAVAERVSIPGAGGGGVAISGAAIIIIGGVQTAAEDISDSCLFISSPLGFFRWRLRRVAP